MSKLSDRIRKFKRPYCAFVVVAAGSSARMAGEDKLFLPLDGKPLLAMTLCALEQCEAVDEIVVVTRLESLDRIGALREEYGFSKVKKMILGGSCRTESSLAGALAVSGGASLIGIHDGARPFVTEKVVNDAVHLASGTHAAAPALPLKDTVKVAQNGVVTATPDRSTLYAIQTPQVFRAELIRAALTKAVRAGISYSDDCGAMEALGCPIHLSEGDEDNIKITTPADLYLARAILEKRRENKP